MTRADRRGSSACDWLLRACVALPLIMLAANLLCWLRWGTDLPFLDDWRAYHEGVAASLKPGHFFQATNNTVSPVGLFLDALAQRWLGGNPIPYQALSMLAVLGGLLWLQWRLLGWALRAPEAQKIAFAFTLFMVQSGSYWGEQNLAYHQALPLLALLGCISLNFSSQTWPVRGRLLGVFVLGLLAGLSYISGAVGALAMAAAWWGWAWLARRREGVVDLRTRARTGAAALGLAGLATLALQWVLTRQPGADQRGQAMPLTWPNEAEFWLYAAGKLGRATGQGFASLSLELAWVAALALGFLALTLGVLRDVARPGAHPVPQQARAALVWLSLLAVAGVYLALVSAGRAGLRPPEVQGAGEVFRFAYGRFHFFWLTPLFPWFAAVAWLRLGPGAQAAGRPPGVCLGVVVAVLALTLGVAWTRGVFDVAAHYRSASEFRAGELRCLARQLGSGRPITCPGFDAVDMPDWTRAYAYARDIGASFVRYLPLVERDGFGQPLLTWTQPGEWHAASLVHARALADGWLRSEGDAQWRVPLPDTPAFRGCRVLGLQLSLRAFADGVTQVFYRPRGEPAYAEARSVRKPYAASAGETVGLEFSLDSATGFEPELRIDPMEGAGRFQPVALRVTCRLQALP